MQDLDFQSIDKYLSSNLIGYKGPSEFKKFSTGQSNPTYLVNAKSGKYVFNSNKITLCIEDSFFYKCYHFDGLTLTETNKFLISLPKQPAFIKILPPTVPGIVDRNS